MDALSRGSTTERIEHHRSVGVAALALGAAVVASAIAAGGAGPGALLYLLFFAAAAAPGLPLGFALFGRGHAAGWVSGALLGYGLTALTLWIPVELGYTSPAAFLVAWMALVALTSSALWARAPAVVLPPWTRHETTVLLAVLLVVPLLVAVPFARVGWRDVSGNRRYRAYFTADVLWHTALTAELAKVEPRPRNPYLARRRLHYYWTYFVPPAIAIATGPLLPSTHAHVLVNALCAGLLFVAAVYVTAWCVIPRAGPVAAAVLLVVLAASAEGLYAIFLLFKSGAPFAELRHLNVDAMTLWSLQSLTIDGLPRALWYTPQHSAACAFGLLAVTTAAPAPARYPLRAALLSGVLLGLALIFSPLPGGTFSLVYGATVLWTLSRAGKVGDLVPHLAVAVPLGAAFIWCIAHETFAGAGSVLAFGLNRMLRHAPLATLALAVGPALTLAVAGTVTRTRDRFPTAAVLAASTALLMFFFVTLRAEAIWIGWRAGQILLVAMPPLVARLLAGQADAGRGRLIAAVYALAFLIGAPTTAIDAWNAQDVRNRAQGPGGFRWTVLVTPSQHAALDWIRGSTPPQAIVQTSVGPRGRETWTLVPTFAERRLAAGWPISLLRSDGDEYDVLSKRADHMFSTLDPADAWRTARDLRIQYVYLDTVERDAFPRDAIAKFDNRDYFTPVFHKDDAAVYAVR